MPAPIPAPIPAPMPAPMPAPLTLLILLPPVPLGSTGGAPRNVPEFAYPVVARRPRLPLMLPFVLPFVENVPFIPPPLVPFMFVVPFVAPPPSAYDWWRVSGMVPLRELPVCCLAIAACVLAWCVVAETVWPLFNAGAPPAPTPAPIPALPAPMPTLALGPPPPAPTPAELMICVGGSSSTTGGGGLKLNGISRWDTRWKTAGRVLERAPFDENASAVL